MWSTFEPIPSISAPIETRKRQRSWMCGSQAAWPSTVSPSASTAAMIAFSVPMTDASSRYMRVPAQPVGRELVDAVDLDVGAERGERVDVRVEAAPADDVAARRRHRHPSEAREQRTCEQERGANLARELCVEVRLAHAARIHADLVRARPFDVGSEIGEQLDHRLDVANARDVGQPHLVRGEHARREDRKRAVLVARRRAPSPTAGGRLR